MREKKAKKENVFDAPQEEGRDKIYCGQYLKKNRIEKGLTIEKLAEETKIMVSVLSSLEEDDYKHLPPPVYLKGIIKKYCRALGIEETKALEIYKESNGRDLFSGKGDALPENRFAGNFLNSKITSVLGKIFFRALKIIFLFSIIAYFCYEISLLVLPAKIIIYSPQHDFITPESVLEISGRVIRGKKLFIKNQEVFLKENGEFFEEISLDPGLNNIVFKAINIMGQTTTASRMVNYSLPAPAN